MKLNFFIASLITLFSFSKSEYFYYDDYTDLNEKPLNESNQDLIFNIESENQIINTFPNEIEPEFIQNEKTSEETLRQSKENFKLETTTVNENVKLGEEILHESSTPINDVNIITDTYQIDDYYNYEDLIELEDYYENTQELISSKETILENIIEKNVENQDKDQSPRVKKRFNYLYVFVPVATISALILVISLSYLFKRINIKKKMNATDHVIYSKVANDIPKV